MALIIPKHYTPKLLPETTEQAIKGLKESFQRALAKNLNLRRVTAPLFVLSGTGINDDLNGTPSRGRSLTGKMEAAETRSLPHRSGIRAIHRYECNPFR